MGAVGVESMVHDYSLKLLLGEIAGDDVPGRSVWERKQLEHEAQVESETAKYSTVQHTPTKWVYPRPESQQESRLGYRPPGRKRRWRRWHSRFCLSQRIAKDIGP